MPDAQAFRLRVRGDGYDGQYLLKRPSDLGLTGSFSEAKTFRFDRALGHVDCVTAGLPLYVFSGDGSAIYFGSRGNDAILLCSVDDTLALHCTNGQTAT